MPVPSSEPKRDWSAVAGLSEDEQARVWVSQWKRTGPRLEAARREALRALTELESARNFAFGFGWVSCPDYPPTSGLVEQQRIFKRAAGAGA